MVELLIQFIIWHDGIAVIWNELEELELLESSYRLILECTDTYISVACIYCCYRMNCETISKGTRILNFQLNLT